MAKLLCLGEALIDRVTKGADTTDAVGGSILNVACVLARLGNPVSLASWWGKDEGGQAIEAYLRSHQVQPVDGCDQAEATTVAFAQIDEDGHATYEFDLHWQVPPGLVTKDFDHVHVGCFSATLPTPGDQVLAAMRQIRTHGTVSYDPNIRPSVMGQADQVRPRIEELVRNSDVVKASDEDLAWLYPGKEPLEVARQWLEWGVTLAVVTKGSAGAVALSGSQEVAMPTFETKVADTVGAGDSFMGGLISALVRLKVLGHSPLLGQRRVLTKQQLTDSLRTASACGALTVSHVGAYAPTALEVAEVLG